MPQAKTALSDTTTDTNEHGGPGGSEGVGHDLAQGGPAIDPVEEALARAIELASNAGQWDVVSTLSRELSARRLSRTAPEVTTLEGERAKREGKR